MYWKRRSLTKRGQLNAFRIFLPYNELTTTRSELIGTHLNQLILERKSQLSKLLYS
jgi:hypothetical protein